MWIVFVACDDWIFGDSIWLTEEEAQYRADLLALGDPGNYFHWTVHFTS